jgi:peptidyl-prolyl cis-trans isomerase B (cyclophilin B)
MFRLLSLTLTCVVLMAAAKVRAQENVLVEMVTSKGTIVIELDTKNAPETTTNFLRYVDEGFYDGTIFHRVIKDFMIQGGGFTPEMEEKDTHDPIKNESKNGLKNEIYTIAMARTSDPHSASSQFFINNGKGNSFLNQEESRDGWGYCVFGRVVEGTDVVDAISVVKTGFKRGMDDVPAETVTIEAARRKEVEEKK